ncbi:hypothetical protein ZYGR_0R00260 [Zygosaccharomyces rouxii]|uniref:ZYRO0F00550p n=2 Tax=Zygosaccharomyces rouxii TaxID=4956 RepID=C5DWY2_ZYGRC|nr:uncharacterized protein ZYRO0F00550g [Zygosaccharomyces rouxii]KAH9199057.1 HIM1-domain-containing protein [Zygosaccharomyces rouxii]GAV49785.1 hypothetical protein ZYGR_0R00260 [Zygosaccharomyces rouxii]CAR28293.1 ZYRO0F00550p [Zygosaccharomyces rouxii]
MSTDHNLTKHQSFQDHILLFGSTGLIGSLTLEELLKVELYLDAGNDLQSKLELYENSDINHFTLNKFFYCVNRKLNNEKRSPGNEYLMERCKATPLVFRGQDYYLHNNTSATPPASQSSNPSLGNNVFEEDGTIQLTKTVDNRSVTLRFRQTRKSYQLEYISKDLKNLLITFHFTIVQLVFEDSTRWADLLPSIFSGEVELVPEESNHTSPRLPHLDQVKTMICTLGPNSSSTKHSHYDRYFVEYQLTFQIVQNFASCEDKRLVIMTSFNNSLVSHIFPYFKAKYQLENDLQNKVAPALAQLVVLRPGPIVGNHVNLNDRDLRLRYSPSLCEQLKHYKEWCWEYKKSFVKEIRKIGFKTKASELVAKAMYRKPGSSVLGYCVPASKAAYATAYMATNPTLGELRIVTSKEIDHLT